ncbi:hypothetical protein [Neisseria weaveri]|uniref:hypothetical protein n=1 Tax=Neisseria weaveri TaxID=28091 RepID=UPI0007C9C597|nr:hypothetical protein [Neisseria weaveri]SAY50908.1 Uncharacterised protein [Neisseria weaveri]
MFDYEQQNKWAERAEEIVKEAAAQNNIEIPKPLDFALAQAVKVHYLSQAGVFSLVEAYADTVNMTEKEVDYQSIGKELFEK